MRSAEKKSAPNKNEAKLPITAATSIKTDKTPVKTSSSLNKPSISETPSRRQLLSRDKDGRLKTAPSKKASAPTSKKATQSANETVQSKNPATANKVTLAKKAIIAKTTSDMKKNIVLRKKILMKAKVVKAEKTRRSNLNIKLPIRRGKSKVCSELGLISVYNDELHLVRYKCDSLKCLSNIAAYLLISYWHVIVYYTAAKPTDSHPDPSETAPERLWEDCRSTLPEPTNSAPEIQRLG